MLFTLGIGSVVALQNVVVTVLCDQFPNLKYGRVAAITSVFGFLSGLVYLTPVCISFSLFLFPFTKCIPTIFRTFQGGQWMIALVDNFGGTLPIFVLAIFELIAIFYFYGLENLAIDIEFMTGRKVSFYWRICWFLLAPIVMSIVYVYSSITMEPLQYAGLDYPSKYLYIGWSIFLFAMIQIPIWFVCRFIKSSEPIGKAIMRSFRYTKLWGPRNQTNRNEWLKYREEVKQRSRNIANEKGDTKLKRKFNLAFGKY